METNERNTVSATDFSVEGININISTGRITLLGIVSTIILGVGGMLSYRYIWGDVERIDSAWSYILAGIVGYIVLQILLLLIFVKGNYRVLGFAFDWRSWGPLCRFPIALKYYRVVLATPAIVFGIIPAIHGFCTGNVACFFAGIILLAASCGDYLLLWKVRHFNDEDKIKDGNASFRATIIKSSY